MDKLVSLKILKQLADGIDPYTGKMLPEDSPYQQSQTVRALFYAIMALEGTKNGTQGAVPGLINAGKSWESAEDDQLKAAFDSGMTISELAQKHKRTIGAIQARLIRLGKLPNT
jgi:hypothetical protein